jgi:hypothetical protein
MASILCHFFAPMFLPKNFSPLWFG